MPPESFSRKGEASQDQCSACPDARSMDASPLPIIITAQSTFALAGLPTVRVVLTAGLHLTDGCHLKVSVVRAKHPKECTPHPHKPGYGCFAPTNNYYRPVHLCSRRSPDRASGIDRRSPPHTLKSPGSFGRKGEASKERTPHPHKPGYGCFALPIIITAQSTFALAGLPTARVVLTEGLLLKAQCHLFVPDVRAKHPKISAQPALMRAVWMLRPYQ
jgi:hypothetical protein